MYKQLLNPTDVLTQCIWHMFVIKQKAYYMQKNIIKTILNALLCIVVPRKVRGKTHFTLVLIKYNNEWHEFSHMNISKDSWYRLGINNSKLSICFYVFEHLILLFGWSCACTKGTTLALFSLCLLKEEGPKRQVRYVN